MTTTTSSSVQQRMNRLPLIRGYEFAETGKLIIQGDNLTALRLLQRTSHICGQVRLVYIDPPFGTRQAFTVSHNRVATISRHNGGELAYDDSLWGRAYLEFLRPRLEALKELMASNASIYVHVDCKVGHYVKCLMDEVFGRDRFINDITRIKCNPKNFARAGYGNTKDMLLFYSHSSQYVWNDLRKPIDISADPRFSRVDHHGRRYTTTPLHAPGETRNGSTGKPWRGLSPPPGRHWRYPPEVLDALHTQGLIEWSSTGNPRKKIYADDVARKGTKIQDVWTFKDPQHPKYPTEKNLAMLEFIVENSSRSGDIVLDAFCGSGTTLLAADRLGRRWVGIDSSPVAIATCRRRLRGYAYIPVPAK